MSDATGWCSRQLHKGRSRIWEAVQLSFMDENPVDARRRIAAELARVKAQLIVAEGEIQHLKSEKGNQ